MEVPSGVWIGLIGLSVMWAWKILNWVWLKPKKLERLLKQQGFTGTPYQFLFGDIKTNFLMNKEAGSKPIKLDDDMVSHALPFVQQTVKHYGKNCYTWFGPIPRVIIMNPDLIKEILNNMYDFQKAHTSPLTMLVLPGLVNHEGDKWAKHRKIINPAFRSNKLKLMVPAFYESCNDVISEWEKLLSAEGSSEIDVWPFLVTLSADAISRTAFGSSYQEGRKIFQLIQQLNEVTLEAMPTSYIPGWRYLPTKLNKKMQRLDGEIQDLLKPIIDKREKAMNAGQSNSNNDLLGLLLESNLMQIEEHGDDKNLTLSTQDVIEECRVFYLAGQETTSSLLVWTMILLAEHQDWQSRAREEILQVFGKNKPHSVGLSQLKVVTMILHEVLRLYPPAHVIVRAANKEMKLGSLTLPEGIEISIPTILIHRDTELWGKDAGDFKPERFSNGISKVTKNQLSYLPFGWGPRTCIGQNFSMMESKIALAMILGKFSVELSPSYAHAPTTLITLYPKLGAHLILRKL